MLPEKSQIRFESMVGPFHRYCGVRHLSLLLQVVDSPGSNAQLAAVPAALLTGRTNARADGLRALGEVGPVEVIFHPAAKVRVLSLEPPLHTHVWKWEILP